MMRELVQWWRSLAVAPAALTKRERAIVWTMAIAVAATRPLAIAKSLWDWDEALFALALRDYDVTLHHPHPPGFPLFIGLAKLIAVTTGATEFRALQSIAVASSLLVFPLMFLLARELRASFFTSVSGAAILAFLPNVWFFGGTAFSDVPSMALSVVASALLLRGVRSPATAVAGFVVLGIAAGFRPQNLLICFVPGVIVLVRRPRLAIASGFATVVMIAASYGMAARLSGGWDAYGSAVAMHQQYIRRVDSFTSAIRPSLWRVADDFWFRPYRVPFANFTVAVLAMAGLLRRRPSSLAGVAIFGPFLVFAWLMLDFHSASRFSIAYVPLHALLAAEGASLIPRVRAVIVAALLVAIGWWMIEPLHVIRTTLSPPVAAAEYIRREYPDRPVMVDRRAAPLADFLLSDFELRSGADVADVPSVAFRELASDAPGARSFTRPRAKLARALTRPRYFEMSVVPVPAGARVGR